MVVKVIPALSASDPFIQGTSIRSYGQFFAGLLPMMCRNEESDTIWVEKTDPAGKTATWKRGRQAVNFFDDSLGLAPPISNPVDIRGSTVTFFSNPLLADHDLRPSLGIQDGSIPETWLNFTPYNYRSPNYDLWASRPLAGVKVEFVSYA